MLGVLNACSALVVAIGIARFHPLSPAGKRPARGGDGIVASSCILVERKVTRVREIIYTIFHHRGFFYVDFVWHTRP